MLLQLCDRCGEQVDAIKRGAPLRYRIDSASGEMRTTIDLCAECAAIFAKWLEEVRVTKGAP